MLRFCYVDTFQFLLQSVCRLLFICDISNSYDFIRLFLTYNEEFLEILEIKILQYKNVHSDDKENNSWETTSWKKCL